MARCQVDVRFTPKSRHRSARWQCPLRAKSGSRWVLRQNLFGLRIEQSLSLHKIARVKAFGEPAKDRSEKLARLIPLALIAPEPRHAHSSAQFPGLCLLRACNSEGALEIRLRFRRLRLRRLQRDMMACASRAGLEKQSSWLPGICTSRAAGSTCR